MKRPLLLLPLLALALPALAQDPATNAPLPGVAWRQADFAAELYRHAAEASGPDKNTVVSPWGAASVFALLQTGAHGETAREIASVLQLGDGGNPAPDAVAATFEKSRADLLRAAGEDVRIELADSLLIRPGFKPEPDFLTRAEHSFGAAVRIAENDGRGPGFPDSLLSEDPLAELAVADSVHLKARWSEEFLKSGTSNRVFRAPGGNVEVPFLHSVRNLAELYDAPECCALRLRYRFSPLEMLVLLPSPSNTVADVEAKLGGPWLDGLLSREWYGKATIAMPKFDIRSEHDLKSLFSAAGMSGAFDEWDADFGGIAPGIHLSAAVQKTAVSVDEEGTTAMATTSALGRPMGILRKEPREFIADRPFLFLIRESRIGLVLFLGKVCNPAALNPDDESHAENAEDAEPKSRAEGAEPATP